MTTAPIRRAPILPTLLPQPLIIPPRNHQIFTSTEMQQQNIHHFFPGRQPSVPVPPPPPPRKRGRPPNDRQPVDPLKPKDPRGGDRKSSKFKASSQIPAAGPSTSSSSTAARKDDTESMTKRVKLNSPAVSSASEQRVQPDPAAERPQQPPTQSAESVLAANRLRDQLLLAGASPEIADEMIAMADFNNCPLDEAEEDGIDPDVMFGDPNMVVDEPGDDDEGGDDLRRQRPTDRETGSKTLYGTYYHGDGPS
ncbi:hypothetical protein HDU98_007735 [Podochytrium sp. JEL0797]|nr:hypothetical protein HDU98_007735 [Podochytrium sp. JEL0797]